MKALLLCIRITSSASLTIQLAPPQLFLLDHKKPVLHFSHGKVEDSNCGLILQNGLEHLTKEPLSDLSSYFWNHSVTSILIFSTVSKDENFFFQR